MSYIIPLQHKLLEAYAKQNTTNEEVIQEWETALTKLEPIFEKLVQKEMLVEISEKDDGRFYYIKKPATVDNIKLALMASILVEGTNEILLDYVGVVNPLRDFFNACSCLRNGDTIPIYDIYDYIDNVDYGNAQYYFLEALLISLSSFDNKHQYPDFSTCIFTATLNSFYALKEKRR